MNVYLTPLKKEHIDQYISLSDDPDLIATMGWKPFEPGERKRFIDFAKVRTLPYLDGRQAHVLSIIDATNEAAIGYVSIKGMSGVEPSAELGIAVLDRRYWGRGYGVEALKRVIDYAFNTLNIDLLGLTVFPSNQRAIRAYEKVGFRKVELLKDSWLLPDGKSADMWLMQLSRYPIDNTPVGE